MDVVEVLYRDAARAYLEAGRTQAAAEALARAARHLEGLDPKASNDASLGHPVAASMHTSAAKKYYTYTYTTLLAQLVECCAQASSQLYMDAVEALEDDGKEGLAGDLFRQAIGTSPFLGLSRRHNALLLPIVIGLVQLLTQVVLSLRQVVKSVWASMQRLWASCLGLRWHAIPYS